VARDTASSAVEEVWEEEEVDQAGAAIQLARKRAASLGGLDPLARRRRLYGFLARRGYEADEIRAALAVVLRGDGDAGDVAGDDDVGDGEE
jgi:regulatory protein